MPKLIKAGWTIYTHTTLPEQGSLWAHAVPTQEPTPKRHADGTPCTCVPGTAGWFRRHCHPTQLDPALLAAVLRALAIADEAFSDADIDVLEE